MRRLSVIYVLSFLLLSIAATWEVKAQSDSVLAGIDTLGNCSDADGGYDHELVPPVLPQGKQVGSNLSSPIGSSFSIIPMAIDELMAIDTSLVITNDDLELLACGSVGGIHEANGRVMFGVTGVGGSGISGFAFLTPAQDPTQTAVSLFVVGLEVAPGSRERPAATPTEASPTAD